MHGFSSQEPEPLESASFSVHLDPSLDSVLLLSGQLFAFSGQAANGPFSVAHSYLIPLSRIIQTGWWACLLGTWYLISALSSEP